MPNASMTGTVLGGRYRITDRIGIGGMAEVYQAQDEVLGRRVAAKVMLPQYAADPEFTRRFKQEAAAAGNLQSPYIVNVYDWGHDGDTYYIIMEYIRGTDLKTGIVQRGALNQRKVAEIGAQVCQALSVAHKQDIIHRDIKPQNIMVQPDGNIKVMDFGIARAKNSVNSKTSSVLGTAHYISPEQAMGKELTPASDIYSLGVVLFEAVTGKLPFDGPDAISVAMKQVNEQPPLPHELLPQIDPGLESIIVKAMQKDPVNRFATANDMRMALNDFLAGRTVNIPSAGVGFGSYKEDSTRVMNPVAGAAATTVMNGAKASAGTPDGTMVMPSAVKPVTKPNQGQIQGQGVSTDNYPGSSGDTTGEKKANRKRVGLIAAILVAVAVVAVAAAAFAGVFSSGKEVPDVTGKTFDEAASIITDAGFDVGTTNTVYDSSIAEGSIVSQDPAGGSKKPEGTKINLTLSGGAEQVNVPDLRGKTVDEAKAACSERGLTLASGTPVYDNDIEANKISSQSPASGEKVAKGSTITYALSLGTEKAAVPDVVGKSSGTAQAELENAGFKVIVEEASSSTVTSGYVISQSTSGGQSLEKGASVTIRVSTGASTAEVPYVVGLTEGSAETKLENAGFLIDTSYTSSSSVKSGYVISQDQSGTLAIGKTVHITVSTGPASSGSDGDDDGTGTDGNTNTGGNGGTTNGDGTNTGGNGGTNTGGGTNTDDGGDTDDGTDGGTNAGGGPHPTLS